LLSFAALCDLLCFFCVQVYDVTSYLDDHPGGSDSIIQNAGVDCTDEFMAVHSKVGKTAAAAAAPVAATCYLGVVELYIDSFLVSDVYHVLMC
jgi:cytochrome b involved in lipid metabolism